MLVWMTVRYWGRSTADNFRIALFFVPLSMAFVIAGTFVAPRHRIAVAAGLSLIRIVMSFIVHIGSQMNPVAVNYLHFLMESLGALFGFVIVIFVQWNRSRSPERGKARIRA
jgi:hypothetical protein